MPYAYAMKTAMLLALALFGTGCASSGSCAVLLQPTRWPTQQEVASGRAKPGVPVPDESKPAYCEAPAQTVASPGSSAGAAVAEGASTFGDDYLKLKEQRRQRAREWKPAPLVQPCGSWSNPCNVRVQP